MRSIPRTMRLKTYSRILYLGREEQGEMSFFFLGKDITISYFCLTNDLFSPTDRINLDLSEKII